MHPKIESLIKCLSQNKKQQDLALGKKNSAYFALIRLPKTPQNVQKNTSFLGHLSRNLRRPPALEKKPRYLWIIDPNFQLHFIKNIDFLPQNYGCKSLRRLPEVIFGLKDRKFFLMRDLLVAVIRFFLPLICLVRLSRRQKDARK